MAQLSIIVAMANQRVIGVDNTLPWRLSADLKRFKAITMGKPIIMGRKTWDSIGRPLPGRLNIVITRDQNLHLDGAEVAHSLDAAIVLAENENSDEIMIMGGANIYEQALPLASKLYLTLIDLSVQGDAWFPEWQSHDWQQQHIEHHHQVEMENQVAFDYRFENWVRREP